MDSRLLSPLLDKYSGNICIICGQGVKEDAEDFSDKVDKIRKFIKYFTKFTTGKGDGTFSKLVLDEEGQQWNVDEVKELEEQLSRIGDSVVEIIKDGDNGDSYQSNSNTASSGQSLIKEFKKLIIRRENGRLIKMEPGVVTVDTGTLIIDQSGGDGGGGGDRGDPGQEEKQDKHVMFRRYHRNDMISAIKAVKKGISAPQAARLFKVPIRTLYDQMKRLGIKYKVKQITKQAVENYEKQEVEEDERVAMALRIKMRKWTKKKYGRTRGRPPIRKSSRLSSEIIKEENYSGTEENEDEVIQRNNSVKEKLKLEGGQVAVSYHLFNGNLAKYAIEAVRNGKSAKEAVRIFNIPSNGQQVVKENGNYDVPMGTATVELIEEGMEVEEENEVNYFEDDAVAVAEHTSGLEEEDDFKIGKGVRKAKRKSRRSLEEDEDFNPERTRKGLVRKYKKSYKESDLIAAIKAVERGELKPPTAARRFGVPTRTIYHRVKRMGIITTTTPTEMKEEESNSVEGMDETGKDQNEEESYEEDVSTGPISDLEEESVEKTTKTLSNAMKRKRSKLKGQSFENDDEDFDPGRIGKRLVRKYKKSYKESDLIAAIDVVEKGELSAPNAARHFGVPTRTLYDRMNKMRIVTSKDYGYCTL